MLMFATACGSNKSEDNATQTGTSATTQATTPIEAPVDKTVPPPAAAGPTITIEGFKFSDLTVPPGAQITVVNNDSAEHSVTSDTAGAFDVEVDGKQTTTFTAPSQPGSYSFYCRYHPN